MLRIPSKKLLAQRRPTPHEVFLIMDAYKWDNRVRFVVRHMYDTDNNGYLDVNDFECLALKYTIYEGKGKYNVELHDKNKKVMHDLWTEMSELADYNRDGNVTVEEFKQGVQGVCMGKTFEQFPQSLKHAINCKFHATDVNCDGLVSLEEFRLDCVNRSAFQDIKEIDDCYDKLVNDADKAAGGINQARYQELYAQFIGSPESDVPGCYLFGPLTVFE
ncbi:sarcoplasmic calcium-binding protein 1-like [Parasteatoda tepidariorum]|uniref:sarcoplasmic calcium-binding protein 1-like n=1 Tax=Parasteatoda tepidariorum TaxID=114398 RepID=UPI00077F830D|nr:sarcoplasmic calcium-binding protein 1-like [Parasteatoda tepidariorum]